MVVRLCVASGYQPRFSGRRSSTLKTRSNLLGSKFSILNTVNIAHEVKFQEIPFLAKCRTHCGVKEKEVCEVVSTY